MSQSFKKPSLSLFASLWLCVLALPGYVTAAWGAVPTPPAFEVSVRASLSSALANWLAAQGAASARARVINSAALRSAVVAAHVQKPLAAETVDAIVYVYLSDTARALQPELEALQAGKDTIARLAGDAARMQAEEASLEYMIGAFQKLQVESTATGGTSAGAGSGSAGGSAATGGSAGGGVAAASGSVAAGGVAGAGTAGASGSATAGGSGGAGAAGTGGSATTGGVAGAGGVDACGAAAAVGTAGAGAASATALYRLAGRVHGISGDLQDLNQQLSIELQRIVTAQNAANMQRSSIYARNAALINSIVANLRL